jgi:hypothetical protein
MLRLAMSAPLFALSAIVVVAPMDVLAQDITTEAKWELDVHLGIVTSGIDGGTSRPLPTATPFTTVTGATSAAVSSWLFGAGTALFNQSTGAVINPLDQALQSGISRRRGGINLGFTLARWLAPRVAIEIQGDYAPTGYVINDVTLASMEKTVTSYTDAWTALFDAGLAADGFPSSVVASGKTEKGGGHQFVMTAGVKAIVHSKRRFRTYVGGSAGFSSTSIRPLSGTLNGAYQFAANVPMASGVVRLPFTEREEVSFRADLGQSRTFVGTVHGGFEYYRDSRRGFRLDVAVLLSPTQLSTVLDATPAVVVQEAGAAIAGPTSPTIQFSSLPAAVARSSLTGPSLRNVETFKADGIQAQVKVSVGYFWRF